MPKTNIANRAKTSSKFHFKWWMGLILVLVVVVVGIVVVRLSKASEQPTQISCSPTTQTKQLAENTPIQTIITSPTTQTSAKSTTQQCSTVAFLNDYTEYHQRTGNINAVKTSNTINPATVAEGEPIIDSEAPRPLIVPNKPSEQCSNLPYSKPTESKYPAVEGSDKFKNGNLPGRQFTLTTTNWLGATGQCFYDNMNSIQNLNTNYYRPFVRSPLHPEQAWCALFVSYVYAANGKAIFNGNNSVLIYTVNEIVKRYSDRAVANQLVLEKKYTPTAGDMVIYEYNGDGFRDHIGIVTATVEDPVSKQRYILTHEGNVRVDPNNTAPYVADSTNIVGMRAHVLDDPKIIGYLRAPGNELPPTPVPPAFSADYFSCQNNKVTLASDQIVGIPTQTIGVDPNRYTNKGGCVTFAQTLLNVYNRTTQNNPPIPLITDGIFGSKSETATKQYQQTNNLTADGVIEPQTWNSLINNCYVKLVCYK